MPHEIKIELKELIQPDKVIFPAAEIIPIAFKDGKTKGVFFCGMPLNPSFKKPSECKDDADALEVIINVLKMQYSDAKTKEITDNWIVTQQDLMIIARCIVGQDSPYIVEIKKN